MTVQSAGRLYDAYYFTHCCGQPYVRNDIWLNFFGSIAERISSDIRPATVLDAGCAMGFLVEGLRQRHIEAFGVDISDFAIERAHPDVKPYCHVASVLDLFPRRYDLIVCIEVLEHLTSGDAPRAVENFCRHTDDILFSSTPHDHKEATHFNVQPPEYWAELFARQGFIRDVDYDASFITPWAVRFRRCRDLLPAVVRSFERKFWLIWKENVDLRALALQMRDDLAACQQAGASPEREQLERALAAQNFEITRLRAQVAIKDRGRINSLQRLLRISRTEKP